MTKQVEIKITEGKAFKLEKGEQYLLFLDNTIISSEDAGRLMSALHRLGFDKSLAVVLNGSPANVVVVKKKGK